MHSRFILFVILALAVNGTMAPITPNSTAATAQRGRILMFVAYNDVWWTEYKVAYEGLRALGYTACICGKGRPQRRSNTRRRSASQT